MTDDSVQIAAPPPLVPLKTAHELKDRTMRDYMRNAGLPGMPSDPVEIEKLVVSDLNLAANYDRDEGPPPAPVEKSAEERAEERRLEDFRLNSQLPSNTQIVRQVQQHVTSFLDLPKSIANSEKWRLCKGRMFRIMEGACAAPRFPDGRLDFRAMVSTCTWPAGAYDLLSEMFSFELRFAEATARHNPYFRMSAREASKKFVRRAMDICDRSTGTVMGNWYVK